MARASARRAITLALAPCYNQRDVMREWTHLHLGLVRELENYLDLNPPAAVDGVAPVLQEGGAPSP